jgi:S-adenosylmethionine:tRNA ribosyltransferase-isomerase
MSALLIEPEPAALTQFELPPSLEADRPPEAEGLSRDDVRLLVSCRNDGHLSHHRFSELPAILEPGDLVVVNTSATIPAAIDAAAVDGSPVVVHFSTRLDGARWVVEPRRPAGFGSVQWTGQAPDRRLRLAGGARLSLRERYLGSGRLWVADVEAEGPVLSYLAVHGRPIRYRYAAEAWPLDLYQTVYATEPGSAEMPSAGRPFTPEVITRLAARGIATTPLILHTGVSSLEGDEEPYPEWFRVPPETALRVNATRRGGGRVIAVGTTAVRALESAVAAGGTVVAREGWTDLVVTAERGVRVADGLLTGWHAPEASHLRMLKAVAGRELLDRSYAAALDAGYRWHEFGDVHLIMP